MTDRCYRCRRRLTDHGSAIINQRYTRNICPTTRGHAAAYDRTLFTGSDA